MASKKVANSNKILDLLKKNYPDAHCALDHKNPFQLLIATILSAQCTDERVNQVTKVLFKRLPSPKTMSEASLESIEEIIRSAGFYKNKAKSLKNTSKKLYENYNSEVPSSMEDLIQLPGVGRKTANVVLGNAFNIPSGIVVDTHVFRLSHRFGWTKAKSPEATEDDLIALFPKDEWIMLSHYLISHGRTLCKARNPSCEKCFLAKVCPKIGVSSID